MTDTIGALQLADWRRRVFGMYAGVRHSACTIRPPATSSGSRLATSSSRGIRSRRCCPTTGPASPDSTCRVTTPTGASSSRCAAPTSRCASRSTAPPTARSRSRSSARCASPTSAPSTCGASWDTAADCSCPVKDSLAGKPGGTYGGGRYLLDTVKGADLGPGLRPRRPRGRLQLRVQPVVRVRPVVVVPARPTGQHRRRRDPGRRADAPLTPRSSSRRPHARETAYTPSAGPRRACIRRLTGHSGAIRYTRTRRAHRTRRLRRRNASGSDPL